MSNDNLVRVFCHKCNAFRSVFHITDNVTIAKQVTGICDDGMVVGTITSGMQHIGGVDSGYQCGKCRTVLAKSNAMVNQRVAEIVQLIELDGFIAEEGYYDGIVEGELIATELGNQQKAGFAFIKGLAWMSRPSDSKHAHITFLRCSAERIVALQPWIGKKIHYANRRFTLSK